jgi:hypothetical protein
LRSDEQPCVFKSKKFKLCPLLPADLHQLVELWAVYDQKVDRLFKMYKADGRRCLFGVWKPIATHRLTLSDRQVLGTLCDSVKEYHKCWVGSVCFETADKARKRNRFDNSGIMILYNDGRNRKVAYGRILRLFSCSLYKSAEPKGVAEVEWFEPLGECEHTGAPILIRNRQYSFNKNYKFIVVKEAYHENVCYCHLDIADALPLMETKFVAIRRSCANVDID